MAEEDDGFVARWARRKRDARSETEEKVAAVAAPEAVAEEGREIDPEAGDPEVIAKLPDIDSLDETSDFTPFMAKGVPEMLRRRALRKLWRINPVFAHLDGLNEYDEDFTDAANLLTEVKTVYKVGQGMLPDKAPEEPQEAAPEVAEEPSPEKTSEDTEEAVPEAAEEVPEALPETAEIEAAEAAAPEPVPVKPVTRRGSAASRRWGGTPDDSVDDSGR